MELVVSQGLTLFYGNCLSGSSSSLPSRTLPPSSYSFLFAKGNQDCLRNTGLSEDGGSFRLGISGPRPQSGRPKNRAPGLDGETNKEHKKK